MKPYRNDEGTILVAEDRGEDAELLQRAFRQAGITNPITVVCDGDQVIRYLEGAGEYENAPLPVVLLLDLRMPSRDGFEVLRWIRAHPVFRALRVIVLTVSESMYDVNRAYQLGANSFLIKTMGLRDIAEQAKQLKSHWIDTPAPDLIRLRVVKAVNQ